MTNAAHTPEILKVVDIEVENSQIMSVEVEEFLVLGNDSLGTLAIMPEAEEAKSAETIALETAAEAKSEKKLDAIAEHAAGKASKTQHRYDAAHGIFTK